MHQLARRRYDSESGGISEADIFQLPHVLNMMTL